MFIPNEKQPLLIKVRLDSFRESSSQKVAAMVTELFVPYKIIWTCQANNVCSSDKGAIHSKDDRKLTRVLRFLELTDSKRRLGKDIHEHSTGKI